MTIKLVSSQSETAVEANRHMEKLKYSASLMFEQWCRIAAGAGSADKALKTMIWFYDAIAEAEETGSVTANGIRKALTEALQAWDDDLSHANPEDHEPHLRTIARGSLRKVASDLAGNLTQERNGRRLMYDGIKQIEKLRAANRRTYIQADKAANRGQEK